MTALGAMATWAVKTVVIPWVETVAVPWLKQKNLLEAAKVAVQYAEAIVGRFNGEEKLRLALTMLESTGWDIKSDEVLQALKAKWQELDLAQVAAGVKGAVAREPNWWVGKGGMAVKTSTQTVDKPRVNSLSLPIFR